MELIRSSWAVALFLIFLGITDLTVHACLICRVSHLQRPRVVFDFAHPASHQLIRNKLQQPTQSFLPTIQPRKRIIRFDEEFIYSCEEGKDTENTPISEEDSQSKLKGVMISMIRWYRNTLSPIMPPNCRFLPSCSNYALQAIDEYGPYRGLILTAWRILRCNPIGGSGYDPPIWPPPGFFAGSNSWRK